MASVRTIGIEPDPAKRIRKRQGDAIRQTRKLRGLSVDGFAEAITETTGTPITPGAIRHWENGRYSPRQHHQIAIAKTLGVPWGVLFALDGEAA